MAGVFILVLLQVLLAGAFPAHKPRERVGYNTTYAGSCTSTVNGARTVLLTFSVRVNRHSINILKAGFNDTSHFGIELANPPGTSATAETGDSKSYAITAFSSTVFGGKASSFVYTQSGQKFTCTNGESAGCLMDFDFVSEVFTAAGTNKPWADLVTEKVRRHWPMLGKVPTGPPPAERLMATIKLSNLSTGSSTTSATTLTISSLKDTLEKNYGNIVSGVTLKLDGAATAESPACTFTVAMDYDIGWTGLAPCCDGYCGCPGHGCHQRAQVLSLCRRQEAVQPHQDRHPRSTGLSHCRADQRPVRG
ncbi:Hypothetical protein GLP15_76 [Giardia lamblia P15]|uniref:Uncharacterized protein n=1 Tax=Giardia intestinalis (strain P15) TaxID=658858 RepID=E1F8F5_GIAIA|nr:Hypothetical protein GLP15_76 [Giardia lamblia P15]